MFGFGFGPMFLAEIGSKVGATEFMATHTVAVMIMGSGSAFLKDLRQQLLNESSGDTAKCHRDNPVCSSRQFAGPAATSIP